MITVTRVVNKHKEDYDVYIGRGSKWGNPYVIGKDGTRKQVIAKYRKKLNLDIQLGKITKEDFLELEGKRLGCFCKPQACHGDVILEGIGWAKREQLKGEWQWKY